MYVSLFIIYLCCLGQSVLWTLSTLSKMKYNFQWHIELRVQTNIANLCASNHWSLHYPNDPPIFFQLTTLTLLQLTTLTITPPHPTPPPIYGLKPLFYDSPSHLVTQSEKNISYTAQRHITHIVKRVPQHMIWLLSDL